MARRGRFNRGPKDPWSGLPKEWKERIDAGQDEELRSESSKVAFNEIANQTIKKADPHLKEAVSAAREAGRQYVDATKANKLKLAYLRNLLEARGKEPNAFSMGLESAA
jgi:hypothetical protein